MSEQRLFPLAVEVVHMHATFVGGQGWHFNIIERRQDEPWAAARKSNYSHLSTEELADVVCSEVSRALGIS